MSDDAFASGITLDMIEAAAARIHGYIRRTPMIEVSQVRDAPATNPLFLSSSACR